MPRPSKIDKLPDEIKEAIGQLRGRGCTIQEILDHLRKLAPDADISWSGMQRHVQKLDAIGAKIRETRAVSEALISKLGTDSENKTARLNMELMHGVLLKLIAGDDGEVTLDIKEARSVADAIAKLSMAQKLDTDNTLRIRREMADKAAKAVEKAVDESGAPDKAELLKRIRQDIYGLVG